MTMVVIEFQTGDEALNFQDERLETLPYLLAQGCYGQISPPAQGGPWEILAPVAAPSHRMEIGAPAAADWEHAARLAASGAWEYLHVVLPLASPGAIAECDASLGMLLAELDPLTVVALISATSFAIVAANNPLHGALPAISVSDLALSLLALGGYPRPDGIAGEALFAKPAGVEADDEAELRERFRGLGYIA